MNVMHERCAGLDVHKQTLVACLQVMAGAQVAREVRSFPTTRADCWRWRIGCAKRAAHTWRWKRPGFISRGAAH